MRRAAAAGLMAAALLAAGCVRRVPVVPAPSPHYVVGPGYQVRGVWFYPREDFHYAGTGLAIVQPERHGLTADGEVIDPSALTASHQTLQLPAVARVTNLETGLQLMVRVNERGPDAPGRLIGISRRAGELLGMLPGATVPVRVEVDEGQSMALRERMQGGPKLALVAAPRGVVTTEALPPPAGISQSARGRNAAGALAATVADPNEAAPVPDRLPEAVQRVPVTPILLRIRAGEFGQMGYARQVAAKLGGIGASVEREREGRSERYTVVAGPFRSVGAADSALDQAMRAGVSDARIVAE